MLILEKLNVNYIQDYLQAQKRYSDRFLDQNNAVYRKEASGTKLDMHRLQTEKILNHIETFGSRPALNKTNY